MKLSIIVLSLDACELTMRCVDSLAPVLERNPLYRLVVIDNGSAGRCLPEALEGSRFAWADRLTVISLPENRGVAGGRNVGLEESRDAEYVMFLDNDTVVEGRAIEKMVAFLDADPSVGIVAPLLVSPEGRMQLSYKEFPGVLEKLGNLLGRKNERGMAQAPRGVVYPFYVIGACQMIRNSVVREIGLLDDNIFFGPEDADFCMRVRKAGYKVAYDPSIRIVHDWQRSSRRSPFSSTARAHMRGLFYFYRKWGRFL